MKNLKATFSNLKATLSCNAKSLMFAGTGALAVLGTSVTAFATETDTLPTIAITTDMLKPLVDGVISNIGVILPVGIGLFAIFLGIRLIPSIISRFVKV